MKEFTCCFSGHRDISYTEIPYIKRTIRREIEELIENGVIYFGVGGARGFDTIVSKEIIKMKKKYSQIKLIIVLPCGDHNIKWKLKDKIQYFFIKKKADKIKVLSPKYYNRCMLVRNEHLVNNSSYLICYIRKSTGGTAYTLKYAEKKKLNIIKI